MSTLTEDEFLDYMTTLVEAERDGARQPVIFGPYTAMLVIGALQLASRAPDLPAATRAQLRAVVDQFRPWFAGTPGEQMIDMGNNPEHDR